MCLILTPLPAASQSAEFSGQVPFWQKLSRAKQATKKTHYQNIP